MRDADEAARDRPYGERERPGQAHGERAPREWPEEGSGDDHAARSVAGYRSRIYDSKDRKRTDPIAVRVVEYELDDPALAGERYRLLTSVADPDVASAEQLAAAYPERWEFETALDELKTHQRGPRLVLRSKSPDGVRQEVYGHLLVHYAIRALMHEVALDAGRDPDRLSFMRSLRVVRRTTRSGPGFSPHGA